jgi:two-component system, chemotaxis family, chemotaxis protein CheY
MVIAALRGLPDTVFLEAGNGLEAIERLAIEPVNLMVLDLNMPEMNGIDTIRFLRAHPSYRQLPVMILSTRGDEDSRRKALDLGANSYSTKPFVPGAFASEVCRLLGASC